MQRLRFPYHQQVANGALPYTIGGGIGQSRLCLIMLNKIHICEVQSSVWDEDTIAYCEQKNITIL